MDLKNFDSTIKSALENIEVPFDPSTWAALESKLDQLSPPEAMDEVLRPALESVYQPYEHGTWSKLAYQLDSLARIRKIRVFKLTEAAILLLLLLNLKGFFGVLESVVHPIPSKTRTQEPVAQTLPSKGKKPGHTKSSLHQEKSAKNHGFAQQMLALVENLTSGIKQVNEKNEPGHENQTANALANHESVLDPANFYSQNGQVKFPLSPVLPAKPTTGLIYASSVIFIPGVEISMPVKSSRIYVATFGSFDKNYLRSTDYSNKKSGFGAGVAVGYRKGKWGVEAGIQYAQKSYQPERKNVEYQNDPFNGISFYHIDHVNADVVSVPVKTTRRLVKAGKTSAHAVAGLTANFATNKSYAFQTVNYPPPVPNPAPNPNVPNTSSLPDGKGLLEDGGLNYNAYATADLGLRVEQSLGKRYTAFLEPIFRQSLGGGLGPNNSRLSTFSVQAGIMANL